MLKNEEEDERYMADNWLRGEYVCTIFSVHTLLNGGSARKIISRVCIECDSLGVILTLDESSH